MAAYLQNLANDPRVNEIYRDGDGIWVQLNPRWCCAPETHVVHTKTIAELKLAMRHEVKICDCKFCIR